MIHQWSYDSLKDLTTKLVKDQATTASSNSRIFIIDLLHLGQDGSSNNKNSNDLQPSLRLNEPLTIKEVSIFKEARYVRLETDLPVENNTITTDLKNPTQYSVIHKLFNYLTFLEAQMLSDDLDPSLENPTNIIINGLLETISITFSNIISMNIGSIATINNSPGSVSNIDVNMFESKTQKCPINYEFSKIRLLLYRLKKLDMGDMSNVILNDQADVIERLDNVYFSKRDNVDDLINMNHEHLVSLNTLLNDSQSL